MHSAAATGANRSRPSKVAPRSGGAGSRASSTTRVTGASPAASAAATKSPLSGPTKYNVPPDGRPTSRQMPRRAVPTPGSTTPSTTPLPRCGTARISVWLPARTSKAGMWCVRSMTVVPGARATITAWTTPANSSCDPKSERKKTVRTGSLVMARTSALEVA